MFRIRFKEMRERAGYSSQQSFADAFGIAQSTVGGWEAGRREPTFDTLVKIADFFGCSTDYLLGRTDIPNAYLIEKEKLPVELADSGVKSVVKLGSAALSEEEVEAIRRLLAERPDLR